MSNTGELSAPLDYQRRVGRVGDCLLCLRSTALTFHHLIPKKMHRRRFFQKTYNREQRAAGIYICRQCHSGIHTLFDEMTLAKHFNTFERLAQDEGLLRHCRWVARQRIGNKA
ncbi:MAG: hypothetical protein V7746_23535 [Halioglobus sp.]